MIRLDIEDYCNKCPNFDPIITERPEILESCAGSFTYGDTVVKCFNCDKCEMLMDYLKTKAD